jgi:hypothetical protein
VPLDRLEISTIAVFISHQITVRYAGVILRQMELWTVRLTPVRR